MIETLYYAYLEGNEKLKSEYTEKLHMVSDQMKKKLEANALSDTDLYEYEEAALRAGFYAGFKAAMNILKEM